MVEVGNSGNTLMECPYEGRGREVRKATVSFVVMAALMLALAAPAMAVPASGGEGRSFGQHHAEHARTMGGFSGDMNPGVMHQGFAGWMGM